MVAQPNITRHDLCCVVLTPPPLCAGTGLCWKPAPPVEGPVQGPDRRGFIGDAIVHTWSIDGVSNALISRSGNICSAKYIASSDRLGNFVGAHFIAMGVH